MSENKSENNKWWNRPMIPVWVLLLFFAAVGLALWIFFRQIRI